MAGEWVKMWIDLGQFVFMLALTLWMALSKKAAVTKAAMDAEINSLKERMTEKNQRITRLEEKLLHMPTHVHLAEAVEKIADTHAEVSRLTGSVDGLRAAVDLMNRHLLGDRL